jgi:glycerophosphoryl diester phosphodiesterase
VEYVPTRPLVIGHRGACGYRPEHTLESYRLAIRLGADYIEPDLVSTRDGVLVARHENEISATTDVASRAEFAGRRTTKVIDGRAVTGWFTEDFTLAELRTLRARERLPEVRPQNTLFDGRYQIPTFQEVIDLASAEERRLGRPIGIYPETKCPSYFASIGLPLEEPLVAALYRNGYADRADHVLIQSFEIGNLRRLRRMTDLRLIQLLDSVGGPVDAPDVRYAGMATPAGLATIAEYAYGIGADKDLLVPRDDSGSPLPTRPIVQDAHAAGLVVHAWTFRAENRFLAPEFRIGTAADARGDGIAEYELFLDLGVDGVFADHPDTAAGAVNAVRRHRQPVTVA